MPSAERCYCKMVMAPKFISAGECPARRRGAGGKTDDEEEAGGEKLWFVDDHEALTNRSNWIPEILDKLLEREEFCSKLLSIMYILYLIWYVKIIT